MTESTEIGVQDRNGVEIKHGDYVKFDFADLMDTPFSNSHFGQLIRKHSLEKCVIHFMAARTFQPDYGWHNTLCYVVYFLKNDDVFLRREDREPEEEPYVRTGDEPPYFTYDVDARFMVYLKQKDRFSISGHSESPLLTLDEVKSA